jgi:hypothetical protein
MSIVKTLKTLLATPALMPIGAVETPLACHNLHT